MRDILACLHARVLGCWRTTLAGAALLAALAVLHLLGEAGIRALAGEVSALGDLLAALTGAAGAVPGLLGAGLVLWRTERGA